MRNNVVVRNKVKKQLVSLGLAAAMVLGMSACGKDNGSSSNENSALAKQYVYSYQDINLEALGSKDFSINTMRQISDRVYCLAEVYNNDGGVAVGTAEADTVAEDMPAEAEGGYQEPQNYTRVLSFKTDGSDIQAYDLEKDDTSSEDGDNTSYWMNRVMFGPDGRVYGIQEGYKEDYSDPENPIYEQLQKLVVWNTDGSKALDIPLESQGDEASNSWLNSMMVREDGTINLLYTGETCKLITLDQSGNQTELKMLDSNIFQNASWIFPKEDGTILVVAPNDDWTKAFASVYDPKTGTEGEKQELIGNFTNYNVNMGKDTDFLLTNSSGIFTYNIGEIEVKQLLSFVNSDLNANGVSLVQELDADHLVAGYYDGENYENHLAIFTKVDPKEVPDKSVLVLGAANLDSSVKSRVIAFNKSNSKYRIAIKDYSQYNTMDNYLAGYTQLNNDIISGQMPDILEADSNMPIGNYIAKGLIEDVGALIANDEELSQEEFMENVFEAYSIDGKLYYVVPNFMVSTMIGKKSLVGDRKGWNMEEFNQVLASAPEGIKAFGDITRDSYMYNVMNYCGSDFVDVATGKCNFNTAEFKSMLEYAKTLPEEIKDEDYDWENYQSQYRDNRALLMYMTIYNFQGLNYNINGSFGEPVSWVGFPNEEKNGSTVEANLSFVLSAKSKNTEGAWEFVRYYLTDEYQKDNDWGLPVSKKRLLEKSKEATQKPYYMDEDGNKVEYDEAYYMNGESITLPPLTQEQVNEVVDFISSVKRTSFNNQEVINIISEETAAFYSGQKSVDDVVNIIQKRVQIYVSDQM